MTKDFTAWHEVKKQVHEQHPVPTFKEREIWWGCVGVNVGIETDGKNRLFNRPVLVLRKFNKYAFYGVPLSTKLKDNRYYLPVSFKGQIVSALISQMRIFDSKRITHLMGRLQDAEFEKVREAIKAIL
jgi:mRNA interferase MazF